MVNCFALSRSWILLLAAVFVGYCQMAIAAGDIEAVSYCANPFELRDVRLTGGSVNEPFLEAMKRNRAYLDTIDLERQLHVFRLTAGLPSTAQPLGGWEAPDHGGRGEFFGHSLSARAMLYAATGDEKLKKQLDYLVGELAKCQDALGTSGYLHAEPESFFDKLEKENKGEGVYYTVHKIMAGLLDVHHYCGNDQALEIAEKMAHWVDLRSRRLTAEEWQKVLNVEFGGMNEVLYNLYGVTHNPRYLEVAHRFDHERILRPLAEGRDELTGLHANTTIPKVIGAARAYELTGDRQYRKMAEFFWRQVVEHRSYATGGTSNFEFWRTAPDAMAKELSNTTHECCCTYNMLKLTRHVFTWTGDPKVADYYERALLNGILGTQNPETGLTMYSVAMAGGYWKTFASAFDSFWCCTGTGSESFAKLADSIYFHNDDSLWVNLFIASELNWKDKGLTLRQTTEMPTIPETGLQLRLEKPVELTLRVRIPYWATGNVAIKLNGKPLEVTAKPETYAEIRRTWQDGDRLDIMLPMSLHLHPMPDDKNVAAIMYGPLLLAGCLKELSPEERNNHNSAASDPPIAVPSLVAKGANLSDWIKPVAGKPLEFRTEGQETDVTLVPFNSLFNQRYAIYWKFSSK